MRHMGVDFLMKNEDNDHLIKHFIWWGKGYYYQW